MKRKLMAFLLFVVLTLALCLTVSANDFGFGFYGIGTAADLTVTPNGTPTEDGFYTGSDRLTVTYAAATPGCEYLVLLTSGDALPTASDAILYIDQKTAESATVEFTVFPTLDGEEEMTLFLTSNDPHFATISVPMHYGAEPPTYTLGDVNGDGAINTVDASMALQYYVDATENPLDATQLLAADIDGNGVINTVDASMILRHYVGSCNVETCPLLHNGS